MNFAQKISLAREKILNSTRPVILFDDDPDGLASFLLLYRMMRAGKGIPLKGSPLNEDFAQKINEYSPDLVIILDKAKVEQEFFDAIKTSCIWIDHHDLQQPKGILYINPQEHSENIPTSSLGYAIAQSDEWIATIGIVADWQLPPQELREKIQLQYPNLLPANMTSAPQALFESEAGILARVFSFNLKGRVGDITSALKILSRIKEPYELLEKKHAQAKLVMKKYEQLLSEYQPLLEDAKKSLENDLIIFTYSSHTTSFTPDLSNELLYLYPQATIFIARESNGSYKCSIRDNTRDIKSVLESVIEEVGGDGGGHENACGAIIPNELFGEFIEKFKEGLKK